MFTDPVRAFLEKPLLARMSTIDPDGFPHTVPVWFMLDHDDIVIISVRKTRKIGHIRQNAKGALVIGGEPQDGAGYLIKGTFSVEEDPDHYWLQTVTNRYESGAQAEKDIADWGKLDMIIVRMKAKSVAKV